MISRFIPHPLLSITLTLVWLGLVNKVTPGNVLLGVIFGVIVPMITAPYWPDRPTLRRPMVAIRYVLVALWDIVVANVQVALMIAFKRNADFKSQWITVPLDLTSPEAITVLAGTITMTSMIMPTPGTPAVPIDARVAVSTMVSCCPMVRSIA